MRLFLAFVLIVFAVGVTEAQDNLKFGDTGTTAKAPKYKSKKSDFKYKRAIHWVKNDARGLLIGNPCMEEVTQQMGFVYLIQPKGQKPNKNGFQRNAHNFFAKIRITFRNGPFWKFKLKKKRNQCRAETSDFVG